MAGSSSTLFASLAFKFQRGKSGLATSVQLWKVRPSRLSVRPPSTPDSSEEAAKLCLHFLDGTVDPTASISLMLLYPLPAKQRCGIGISHAAEDLLLFHQWKRYIQFQTSTDYNYDLARFSLLYTEIVQ